LTLDRKEAMITVITLDGVIPSKKNSRINIRSGRSFPSKAYSEWHKRNLPICTKATKYHSRCSIHILFFFGTLRRSDLTNKAESVMDLLVDAGVIKDDCWTVVPVLTLSSVYGNGKNGAEITISEYM